MPNEMQSIDTAGNNAQEWCIKKSQIKRRKVEFCGFYL